MKISEWLHKKEADGIDVSQVSLPDDLSYDEVPDETIFFKEIITPAIEHVNFMWHKQPLDD